MARFTLTNLKTGKIREYEADDPKRAIIEMRFALDMGTCSDKTLQKEYTETGLEVFRFDTVD